MHSAWKPFRYRLEWIGLVLAAKAVPLLSRRLCCFLAGLVGSVVFFGYRQARAVALANLAMAFGDQYTPRQRRQIVGQSFRYFAQTILDFLWSPRLTQENFSRYIELENFEETETGTGPERSIMIACYHYGNFEWLSLACGFLGLTGTIISQPFKNPLLDPIFQSIRERSGHELVSQERGIMRLYKVLRRKGRTALLVDLTVPPAEGAVIVDCFGLKTSVTAAHAWLHQQTDTPIIPAHCEPLPGGRYRLVFHAKIANKQSMSLQQMAQACWDSFEPVVRRKPAPWLWMYKHWRYRPKNADRPYPFYANVSPQFEKLLRESPKEVAKENTGA